MVPRATQQLRLQHLDPMLVAAQVLAAAIEHFEHLAGELSVTPGPLPGVNATDKPLSRFQIALLNAHCTPLGERATLLTEWAKSGTNAAGWGDKQAWDAMTSICKTLYSQATRLQTGPLDPTKTPIDYEPVTDVETVLLAAFARALIITNASPVPVRALAALGSLTTGALKNLGSAGEIRIQDGEVRPKDALRWLRARGVKF